MENQKIELKDIPDLFLKEIKDNKLTLKYGQARDITINLPFYLDKDISRMFGMLFDGSLSKDLKGVMFSQKKDPNKMYEVAEIIRKKFNIEPKIEYRPNGDILVKVSNKTLSNFLYHCLNFYKCDESGRLPKWLYLVDVETKKEFLRYAFAMEGSIDDPAMMDNDIRFHSCDYKMILELKKFIKKFFEIGFNITKYYIKNYGYKYYLIISDIESIRKFSKIGFALESHEKRLKDVLLLHHSKAWEITLVALFKTNKNNYSFKEIHELFPYIKNKGAIIRRINILISQKYLEISNDKYFLTKKGEDKAKEIEQYVNISRIRTSPKDNEKLVIDFLRANEASWINKISRSLNIHRITILDTIKRLEKQGKIKFLYKDKFQRKFYSIKNSGDWNFRF